MLATAETPKHAPIASLTYSTCSVHFQSVVNHSLDKVFSLSSLLVIVHSDGYTNVSQGEFSGRIYQQRKGVVL